ncbi:MAG: hypothetical protein V7775_16935 [Sulfitobacter sp.]
MAFMAVRVGPPFLFTGWDGNPVVSSLATRRMQYYGEVDDYIVHPHSKRPFSVYRVGR